MLAFIRDLVVASVVLLAIFAIVIEVMVHLGI